MTNDERYMYRCLQLAANGIHGARPNPLVGAVIVAPISPHADGDNRPAPSADCRIIGEGYHVRCGEGHAEVNAFASVRPEDERLLPESTVYVSLEPCAHYGRTPPCAELIVKKGVRRVVVGCIDPFAKVQGRGIDMLRQAGIQVTVGVLEAECQWLNRRFLTYHRHHRPYIILKWAQTANGFIDDHGRALAVSNEHTLMLSHQLRAQEDAILVGHTTYLREHPQLTVRHWHGPDPQRIVLTRQRPLPQLIDDLYQHQVQSLIVEGGRQTLQAFLNTNLWDELRVETNHRLLVSDGTAAPLLPVTARQHALYTYGDNTLAVFTKNHELH